MKHPTPVTEQNCLDQGFLLQHLDQQRAAIHLAEMRERVQIHADYMARWRRDNLQTALMTGFLTLCLFGVIILGSVLIAKWILG